MEIRKTALEALRLNDANPRMIKDIKFHKLVKSILTFPEMRELREIVVDESMTILGGNMRCRALLHIARPSRSLSRKRKRKRKRVHIAERRYDHERLG